VSEFEKMHLENRYELDTGGGGGKKKKFILAFWGLSKTEGGIFLLLIGGFLEGHNHLFNL